MGGVSPIMPIRLDQIQEQDLTFDKAIRLSDIPDAMLTPDEIEALANKTFDYADKERVSMREAQKKVGEHIIDEMTRRNLAEANKIFGTHFKTDVPGSFGNLQEGIDLDNLTFGKKIGEIAKAVHRGTGSVLKIPGIALKMTGESAPTRKEIEDKLNSDSTIQNLHGQFLKSLWGKSQKNTMDMIRRAGNAYIDKVNEWSLKPSKEAEVQLQQPFSSAPVFRSLMATGESAPSYGVSIAAALTTGNPWAGLAVIGSTSASQSYENLRNMGVDPDLATVGALMEGTIEIATEKIPMNELMKGGGRALLVRALRLGTMESFQELFAQLGQNYVEAAVKDIDPEDYSTALKAARQEWSVIANGWQDAMAAGFIMGGGAAVFSPRPDMGRSDAELINEYGILPQKDQDFLNTLYEIRNKVKDVEKQAEAEQKAKEEVPLLGDLNKQETIPLLGDIPPKIMSYTEAVTQPVTEPVGKQAGTVQEQTPEDAQRALGIWREYIRTGDEGILEDMPLGAELKITPTEVSNSLVKTLDTPEKRAKYKKDMAEVIIMSQDGTGQILPEEVAEEMEAYQKMWGKTDPLPDKMLRYFGLQDISSPSSDSGATETPPQSLTEKKTWVQQFNQQYDYKGFKDAMGSKKSDSEVKKLWSEFKDFSKKRLPEDDAISEHFEVWFRLKDNKYIGLSFEAKDQLLKQFYNMPESWIEDDKGLSSYKEFKESLTEKEKDLFKNVINVLDHIIEKKPKQKVKKGLLDKLTDTETKELESLEKKFQNKIKNQLFTGLDPELFILATKIGSYYVKAGYRAFKEWASMVRSRIGEISNYTLRTVYANLRNEYPDLDSDEQLDRDMIMMGVGPDIGQGGEGEIKVRGLAEKTLLISIQKDLIAESEAVKGELSTYERMNMEKQAELSLDFIKREGIEKAKRVAFNQGEQAPEGLYPENIYTALRNLAIVTEDTELMREIILNEGSAEVATVMGKRIKSLDTGIRTDTDPIKAMRDVVETRKEVKQKEGEDISKLETQLRQLQSDYAASQRQLAEYHKKSESKARREYGSKNKLVTKTEYDAIIERRRIESATLRHGKRMGAVYVPTQQDFIDMAKIGMFHLEALGRDFAKWSYEMTSDLGEWVKPHLQEQYNSLIKDAESRGMSVPESKRLESKKKRLGKQIEKTEKKLEDFDFEKEPRFEIELDEEGKKLQADYNLAREKLKAAQATANLITEEEVRIIAQLAKEVSNRRDEMEGSKRRDRIGAVPTKEEAEYGVAVYTFLEYVDSLKKKAKRRTIPQAVRDYLKNPIDFIIDIGNIAKTVVLNFDNSFHGNQGLAAFLKGIALDIPSARIWLKTFLESFRVIYNTITGKDALRSIFAQIVSDPDYNLIRKTKTDLMVTEEESPTDIVGSVPYLGRLFFAGENAMKASAWYMRYQLASMYINIWRKSGVKLDKYQLESIGALSNSLTLRGKMDAMGGRTGALVNIFTSIRNIKGTFDILTAHTFSRNISPKARIESVKSLIRMSAGAYMILALANWIDDDSVTSDTTSSDFGTIKVGNTRFSVLGPFRILAILGSRIAHSYKTSSTTGKKIEINKSIYGMTSTYLIWNFFDNKMAPLSVFIRDMLNRHNRENEPFNLANELPELITPLTIQTYLENEAIDPEERANLVEIMILSGLGMNVNTYGERTKNSKNKGKHYDSW